MQYEIGEAAGRIWQTLNAGGPMTKDDLKSKTKLDAELLAMALGWLSREDKINLEKVGKKKLLVSLRQS